MQCAACHFENLPGLRTCARCASPLVLGSVAIAPPRASRLRLRTRLSRAWNGLGVPVPDLGWIVGAVRRLAPEPLPWAALACSVVPGLGQLRIRQWLAGALFLSAWTGLLIASVVVVGSGAGALWWWLAISVHASAVLHLFGSNLNYTGALTRLLFGLVAFVGLYLAAYRPLAGLVSRFAVVMPVGSLDAPFEAGTNDVLLIEGPWLRRGPLERGDLVFREVRPSRPGPVLVRAGHVVDRIVGIPRDVVVFHYGGLKVNGQVPQGRGRPLSDVTWPIDLEWQLGPDEFVVFPSRASQYLGAISGHENEVRGGLLDACRVARHEIVGRVFWRLRPWSRFGAVE